MKQAEVRGEDHGGIEETLTGLCSQAVVVVAVSR